MSILWLRIRKYTILQLATVLVGKFFLSYATGNVFLGQNWPQNSYSRGKKISEPSFMLFLAKIRFSAFCSSKWVQNQQIWAFFQSFSLIFRLFKKSACCCEDNLGIHTHGTGRFSWKIIFRDKKTEKRLKFVDSGTHLHFYLSARINKFEPFFSLFVSDIDLSGKTPSAVRVDSKIILTPASIFLKRSKNERERLKKCSNLLILALISMTKMH